MKRAENVWSRGVIYLSMGGESISQQNDGDFLPKCNVHDKHFLSAQKLLRTMKNIVGF